MPCVVKFGQGSYFELRFFKLVVVGRFVESMIGMVVYQVNSSRKREYGATQKEAQAPQAGSPI
jgi:hypothetical protein